MELNISKLFSAELSDSEFAKLGNYIVSEYGIKMPPEKKVMLQSRLQKRLRAVGIESFKSYIEFVFSKEGANELIHMIDVVSTNKTDFFREAVHFECLRTSILPDLYKEKKTIKLWSAGCSSGQEVYTLAIELSEFAASNSGFDFSILGTDISTAMLKQASSGVYSKEQVDMMSFALKKKYLLKSKDEKKQKVKIKKELRNKVRFERLNFMDERYSVTENFDIIFCRNVLIYFDRATQEKVIKKLCKHLRVGGFLFLGHSESLAGIDVPLKQFQPTVHLKI